VKALIRPVLLWITAALVVGVPFWVIIVSSFKPFEETVVPSLGLPETWTPGANYSRVFREGDLAQGFTNNALLLAGVLPTILLLSASAAWVLARSKSLLLKPLHYMVLIGIVVPPAIVATIFTLKRLGVFGGLFGLGLFYSALYVPLGIFLLTGFIKTIPGELEEAARIDGAGNIAIFWRIILPLLRPSLITISIIVSIAIWNDFLNPFMLMNDPDSNTLILKLFDFATKSTMATSFEWNVVFADIVITSAPMVAAFYLAQKYMVHGLGGIGR
jgi:raffinose/stachyose/melibiose transport system permease protein